MLKSSNISFLNVEFNCFRMYLDYNQYKSALNLLMVSKMCVAFSNNF